MIAPTTRIAAAAALAAGVALAPAAAAPAAPRLTLLGTFDFGKAAEAGSNGRAAGLWSRHSVRSGFTGDDLEIQFTPTGTARPSWIYLTTQDFNGRCATVGDRGKELRVWVQYRCAGFAGDSLEVR
ncbi:hypothetical protein GCM10010123_26010 [Pilimelia anulata]|uniref:Uncharacterized protein n=1 Tax=Pilimelia anulata TaxID=53371 RepID=A0A8J3B543_9ACTN|nr:hypothetical protein [Pilimelia anulata]GGJ95031.1 hypothetical protein GCM10010123_26010 [Pilimelia anulata]